MKRQEWNEGLNHVDFALVEEHVAQRDELKMKQKRTVRDVVLWRRIGIIAACVCLIVVGVFVIQEPIEGIPIRQHSATSAPMYYGSNLNSSGEAGEVDEIGMSVTAKWVETLPDVYTMYSDWNQREYRLLKMKTIAVHAGREMPEEFYYLVPADYMTDFSVYDQFVMINMSQITYEYYILYNHTLGCPETKELVLFGYSTRSYRSLGKNFMAFDQDGNFDNTLWQASDAWMQSTKNATGYAKTLSETEELAQDSIEESWRYVHLLDGITEEVAAVLENMKQDTAGVFVPRISSKLGLVPEVQFNAVKYIDGFATNESIRIFDSEYTVTKAHFDKKDLQKLPDLTSAIATIASAYEKGEIAPPHIQNYAELAVDKYGIFGWYAKTASGVIGIVRVDWDFEGRENFDDRYYIVEYDSDVCVSIDRDDLLKLLGSYESTYIFDGEYDENGKIRGYRDAPV